jgi:hypothetical protein
MAKVSHPPRRQDSLGSRVLCADAAFECASCVDATHTQHALEHYTSPECNRLDQIKLDGLCPKNLGPAIHVETSSLAWVCEQAATISAQGAATCAGQKSA